MSPTRRIIRVLATHIGLVLRRGILAAILALAISWALPQQFESEAMLVPPTRRTDVFRYDSDQSLAARGFRRLLKNFRLQDEAHPIEIARAVFESRFVALQLADRLQLMERWNTSSMEETLERIHDSLEVELIPFGGIAVRARASDPELARDLVNEAVALVDTRIRELAARSVDDERGFLDETTRSEEEGTRALEASLASYRIAHGLADTEDQSELALDSAVALQRRLVDARLEQHRAVRDEGASSAAARDAAIRVQELEEAARTWPMPLRSLGTEAAREKEIESGQRTLDLLEGLRGQIATLPAANAAGLGVIDPAIAAEHPARLRWFVAALLAFLVMPFAIVAREFAPAAGDALRRESEATGQTLFARVADAFERLPRPGPRLTAILAVAVAAVAGVVFARMPILFALASAPAFVLVLAADLVLAWFLLVITLPWAWEYVNRQLGVAILTPTEPAIALFVGAWAYVLVLRARWRIPREPLFYAMIAQLAWMAICAILSTNLRLSIAQTVSTAGFVAVGALFPMFEIRSLERIESVIRVYLIFGILLSLYGIAQIVASPLPFDRAATFVGAGLLYNHGPYAAFLGFALGPAFVYTLMSPLDRRSILPILCGVLTLVATVLSLTRAAWLGTAALLLVFGVSRTRTFLRSLGVPLIATTLLTVLAIASVPNAKASLERFLVTSVSSRNVSNLERINRWAAGFRMIVRNPLVGVGPGAFEAVYPDYRDVEFVTVQSEKHMGAHSDMIRAASEQGIPGLLILGTLVVVFYRTGLRLMRHPELRVRRLAAALCAGVFTYTIHSLFNEYWRVTKVAISLWIFVGLLGALARFVDSRDGSPPGDAVAGPGES